MDIPAPLCGFGRCCMDTTAPLRGFGRWCMYTTAPLLGFGCCCMHTTAPLPDFGRWCMGSPALHQFPYRSTVVRFDNRFLARHSGLRAGILCGIMRGLCSNATALSFPTSSCCCAVKQKRIVPYVAEQSSLYVSCPCLDYFFSFCAMCSGMASLCTKMFMVL